MPAETKQYLTSSQIAWIAKVLAERVILRFEIVPHWRDSTNRIAEREHAFLVGLVEAKLSLIEFEEYQIHLSEIVYGKNNQLGWVTRDLILSTPNQRATALMLVWKD